MSAPKEIYEQYLAGRVKPIYGPTVTQTIKEFLDSRKIKSFFDLPTSYQETIKELTQYDIDEICLAGSVIRGYHMFEYDEKIDNIRNKYFNKPLGKISDLDLIITPHINVNLKSKGIDILVDRATYTGEILIYKNGQFI